MKHLAIVRSVSTQDDSHSAGVERIQRGDPKNRGVTYPFFGSAVAKLVGPGDSGLPPYVWVKPMSGGFIYKDAGFLGPKYGALALGDGKPPENLLRPKGLTAEDDDERNDLRKLLDKNYAADRRAELTEANSYAYEMAAQLQKKIELFDTSKLPQKDQDRYGTHDLGRHMLLARRLLEAGVTFVKVTSYGWDTHGDHFNGAASLHPKFDRPFAAIIEDLADRGMLDNVLVIAMRGVRPHAAHQRAHRPRPLAAGVERGDGRARHQEGRRGGEDERQGHRGAARPGGRRAGCSTPGSARWA